jgi:tetratricopeptide (TPR) repeat protein
MARLALPVSSPLIRLHQPRGACNARDVTVFSHARTREPAAPRWPRRAVHADLCLALYLALALGLTPAWVGATADGAVSPSPDATETAQPSSAATDAAQSPPPATLSPTDAYSEFRRLFDAGQYESAVPYAQRLLELAGSDATTPGDEEVQVALMNLAMTQYLSGDYVAAEASYQRVIELVESSGRPLHSRLARAHAGLASSYHAGNRHDLAVKSFEQAVSLTRRQEGLLTDKQVPLLEKYIDSLTELGRYQDALKGQRYVLRIATRQHGPAGVGLAPTLVNIGRWYADVGAYDQARRLLKRAIAIVETAEGPDSARLVSALSALASCNRRQLLDPSQQIFEARDPERAAMFHEPGVIHPAYSPAMLLGEGEKALLRAAQIAETKADTEPVQVADVQTQLGDWYQGRGQPERAVPHYRKAWAAASRVTDRRIEGRTLTEALFGKPVLLQIVRPDGWSKYAERPPEQIETRNVVVNVTVDADGAARQPRIIDDGGDPKLGRKTVESIETARYRPRIEHGEPVATADVTFSQPWIVLLPPPEGKDKSGPTPAPTDTDAPPSTKSDGR